MYGDSWRKQRKDTNWDSAEESQALFTYTAQSMPVGKTQLTPQLSPAHSHLSWWSKGNFKYLLGSWTLHNYIFMFSICFGE